MNTSPPDHSVLKAGRCALIGMVHLQALPGSPGWGGSMEAVLGAALRDAERLLGGGCDALMLENMGDLPFLAGRVEPETVAAAARVTSRVVALGAPTGIQLLAGANREALGVALACGCGFVRAEAFAYAHVADEGLLEASAGPLLRARAALGAAKGPRRVEVWADVQKKHAAHALTRDLSLEELARGNAFCGADALIVTGSRTGSSTSLQDLSQSARAGLPVIVGSGVTPADAADLARAGAQGLIVGTWLKEQGDWRRPVDEARVRALRAALDAT